MKKLPQLSILTMFICFLIFACEREFHNLDNSETQIKIDAEIEQNDFRNSQSKLILKSAPAGCVTPPPGLVAWWPAEGNANDVFGEYDFNDNAGPYISGKVGLTFNFNGDGESVTRGESIPMGGDNWGLEAWIYWHGLSGDPDHVNQGIFHNKDPEENGLAIVINEYEGFVDFGTLDFYYGNIAVNPSIILPDNQWFHFALTIENGVLKTYINAALVYSNDAAINISPPSGGFCSISAGYPYAFNGLIDDLSVYDDALSASSISAIYNAGNIGKCPTPELSIYRLVNSMNDIVNNSALNKGNRNALITKLNGFMEKIGNNNLGAAIKKLSAFINQVNDFINSGKLSPAEGQSLIDSANDIIVLLEV